MKTMLLAAKSHTGGAKGPKGDKLQKGQKKVAKNSTLRPKMHLLMQKRAGVHVHHMKTMLQAAKSGYFPFCSF